MKKINFILRFVYSLICILFMIKNIISLNISKIILSILIMFLVYIPKLKKDINEKLLFIYYIYILFTLIIGYLFNFFDIFIYYDVFIHFSLGFSGSLIGLMILRKFNIDYKLFNIIFMIFTVLFIAGVWEILEYLIDIIFKCDLQDVSTGVRDTIEDVSSAFTCSIIFSIYYYFNKNKVDSLFI